MIVSVERSGSRLGRLTPMARQQRSAKYTNRTKTLTMIKQAPMMNMSHCMRSVAAHAINLPGAVAHCIWSRNANVSNLTIGIATSTNQLTCHG